MKLVADVKDYSADRKGIGFVLLVFSTLLLFVLPFYLVAQPPGFLRGLKPVIMAEGAGCFVFLIMLAVFMKSRGMLFKVPLRVYDESVLIQPALSLAPRMIPYARISSIELWYESGCSGCAVQALPEGRVKSVECFSSRQKAKDFTDSIRPAMESSGFTMKAEEDARSFRAMFRKTRAAAPSSFAAFA
jgi:hypothetical protein